MYGAVHSASSIINLLITASDEPKMDESMNATGDESELWRTEIDMVLKPFPRKIHGLVQEILQEETNDMRHTGRRVKEFYRLI